MLDDLFDRLGDARDQLIDLGIGILQLLVVFVVAALVARWLRGRIRRRVETSSSPVLTVVAENAAVVGVYVVAITVVLAFWGLTWAGLLTALSIGTVAAAFGFQDLLRSVVGGVLVLIEQPFALGDRVKIRDVEGRVEQIELRTTVIRADNGDRIAVPNALIFSDPVVNRSPNRTSHVLNVSGIEGAPEELKKKAREALSELPVLEGPPVISARTRKTGRRVGRALDAIPGVDTNSDEKGNQSRGIGLRIVWTGDNSEATRNQVKRRLEEAFPGARISTGNW